MELLKEITDTKFPETASDFNIREASRAVIFDENQLVPLLFVSKFNYHKLPGGGVERDENKEKALVREVKEEVWCEVEIVDEVWKIIEFRTERNQKQASYCYLCKVISKGELSFTQEELGDWFKVIRVSLDEVISLIENDKTECYISYFIQKRDLIFLKKAKQMKGSIS